MGRIGNGQFLSTPYISQFYYLNGKEIRLPYRAERQRVQSGSWRTETWPWKILYLSNASDRRAFVQLFLNFNQIIKEISFFQCESEKRIWHFPRHSGRFCVNLTRNKWKIRWAHWNKLLSLPHQASKSRQESKNENTHQFRQRAARNTVKEKTTIKEWEREHFGTKHLRTIWHVNIQFPQTSPKSCVWDFFPRNQN